MFIRNYYLEYLSLWSKDYTNLRLHIKISQKNKVYLLTIKMSLNAKITTCIIFAIFILIISLYMIIDFYSHNKDKINPKDMRENYVKN